MSIKSLFIKAIRNGVGLIIVFADWISRPKALQRSEQQQLKAQEAVSGMSLYQFYACPFCVKTRRAVHRLNVELEVRDINTHSIHRDELEQGGGRIKVPCLRIEDGGKVTWMYESNDIIRHLENTKIRKSDRNRLFFAHTK